MQLAVTQAILSAKAPAQPADLRLPHIDPQLCTDREEKAKQKQEMEQQGNGEAKELSEAHTESKVSPVKAEPIKIVKGTFQDVLARRQAELAALKRLKERANAKRRRTPSPIRR